MGILKILGHIATVITILVFINQIWQFVPGLVIPIPDLPLTGNVVGDKPAFGFSQINVEHLFPLRPSFYNGSNNVVCYSFNNPNNATNENFTLIGEWFIHNDKEPLNKSYIDDFNYEEVFNGARLNWRVISSDSVERETVRFRVALKQGVNSISKEITYPLIFNESLSQYLKNDDDGLVRWDDSIIKEFINKKAICGLPSDEQIAERTLEVLKGQMNRPAETREIIEFNNKTVDSVSSWNSRIGTSSEYSASYAMLLRALGIPSKLEVNKFGDIDYYYTKYFSRANGWTTVDAYGDYDEIKGCLSVSQIKKDRILKDICILSLNEYLEFKEIKVYNSFSLYPVIEGKMLNKWNKPIKSYCAKVNLIFYDEDGSEIYKEEDRYISPTNNEDLEVGEEANFGILISEEINYDNVKIELHSFADSCK